MQIVIDIPKYVYEAVKEVQKMCAGRSSGKTLLQILVNSVQNGTPLPKGHGKLIDADKTLKAMDTWDKFGYTGTEQLEPIRERNMQNDYVPYVHYEDMVQCVANMPTIIEADKEERR